MAVGGGDVWCHRVRGGGTRWRHIRGGVAVEVLGVNAFGVTLSVAELFGAILSVAGLGDSCGFASIRS